MNPHRLLFICTGNICRSPMAEGLARHLGAELGRPIEARSASTLGLVDRPADPHSVTVCRELGVDIQDHRSRPILAEDVAWADRILVMEGHHANHLHQHFPGHAAKVMLLGLLIGRSEIADPIGRSERRFRACRDEIHAALRSYVKRLPAR